LNNKDCGGVPHNNFIKKERAYVQAKEGDYKVNIRILSLTKK
jgi:hypothetical protein